jgi:hypothetical protein
MSKSESPKTYLCEETFIQSNSTDPEVRKYYHFEEGNKYTFIKKTNKHGIDSYFATNVQPEGTIHTEDNIIPILSQETLDRYFDLVKKGGKRKSRKQRKSTKQRTPRKSRKSIKNT